MMLLWVDGLNWCVNARLTETANLIAEANIWKLKEKQIVYDMWEQDFYVSTIPKQSMTTTRTPIATV